VPDIHDDDGDPGVDVELGVATIEGDHVIGPPADALGEVGGFDFLIGGVVLEQPDEGGFGDEVIGYFGEDDGAGMAEEDFFADLVDGAFVDAEECGEPILRERASFIDGDEPDVFPDVFFHEFAGAYEVVFVVLLENSEGSG